MYKPFCDTTLGDHAAKACFKDQRSPLIREQYFYYFRTEDKA